MTTVENAYDFKKSGNWEVFAMNLQEKISNDSEPNLSTESNRQNESIVNSEEMQQILS